MRILTVKQPWAWAIIHGGKDVENRVRNLAGGYRGPVAIHAGLGWAEGSYDDWEIRRAIRSAELGYPADEAQTWASDTIEDEDQRFAARGAIIGVVDIAGVHTSVDCWQSDIKRLADLHRTDPAAVAALPDSGAGGLIGKARLCSAWAQFDVTHLQLADPRPLAEPIPYKGALGLRTLPDDVEQQVLAAVKS